jgi:hypothetical protein
MRLSKKLWVVGNCYHTSSAAGTYQGRKFGRKFGPAASSAHGVPHIVPHSNLYGIGYDHLNTVKQLAT